MIFDLGDLFFGRHVYIWFRFFAYRSSKMLLLFVLLLLSHIKGSKEVLSPCLPQSLQLLSLITMSLSSYSSHCKSSFPLSTVKPAVHFLLLFCFSRLAVALSGILLLLWHLMILRCGDDVILSGEKKGCVNIDACHQNDNFSKEMDVFS
jgi:hypothetical protein